MRHLAVVAALAAMAALAWYLQADGARAERPAARWRNGVIVAIRNCETPADERARLQCASLYCARRVTELLTNAQQAELRIDRYVRDPATGAVIVSGSLDQYLKAPTLPTGFRCRVDDRYRVEPEFLFGRRAALTRPHAAAAGR